MIASMICVADRVHRAERGHRLLRDQRDLGAAQVAHQPAARRQAREVDRRRALGDTGSRRW